MLLWLLDKQHRISSYLVNKHLKIAQFEKNKSLSHFHPSTTGCKIKLSINSLTFLLKKIPYIYYDKMSISQPIGINTFHLKIIVIHYLSLEVHERNRKRKHPSSFFEKRKITLGIITFLMTSHGNWG